MKSVSFLRIAASGNTEEEIRRHALDQGTAFFGTEDLEITSDIDIYPVNLFKYHGTIDIDHAYAAYVIVRKSAAR